MTDQDRRFGFFCAIAAYVGWGLFPIYFNAIAPLGDAAILAHRIVWTTVLITTLLLANKKLKKLFVFFRDALLHDSKQLMVLLASALLIGANWILFVHAVATGNIMQSSLAYFINPLLSIFLGMLFLKEHLRPRQKLAILFAAIGVTILIVVGGEFPWLALSLAGTFGLYGLLRKFTKSGALLALGSELWLLFPFALTAIFFYPWPALEGYGPALSTLMIFLIGPLTGGLLLLFGKATKTLPLSTVGILQYLTPTGHFLCALAYGEKCSGAKLASFIFVWIAVAVYCSDFLRSKKDAIEIHETVEELNSQ